MKAPMVTNRKLSIHHYLSSPAIRKGETRLIQDPKMVAPLDHLSTLVKSLLIPKNQLKKDSHRNPLLIKVQLTLQTLVNHLSFTRINWQNLKRMRKEQPRSKRRTPSDNRPELLESLKSSRRETRGNLSRMSSKSHKSTKGGNQMCASLKINP